MIIWRSPPQKHMFWYAWCKKQVFEFWPLMRGQRLLKMTSKRLKWKIEVIFEFPTPQNLNFDRHDAKTLFWILTSDERSEVIVDDLWEVKIKNWGHFWVPHPKRPTYWYAWCKKLFFEFWPQMRGQRSFLWPLRGQIDWKSIFYPYSWLVCSNRKK